MATTCVYRKRVASMLLLSLIVRCFPLASALLSMMPPPPSSVDLSRVRWRTSPHRAVGCIRATPAAATNDPLRGERRRFGEESPPTPGAEFNFLSSPPPTTTSLSRREALVRSCAAALTMTATATTISSPLGYAARAITADEASSSYDRYAPSYDALDGGRAASALGIDEARTSLLRSYARGRVLEVGAGTGLNVDRYRLGGDSGVTSLTLCDISGGMLTEARAKVEGLDVPPGVTVDFVKADATSELAELFGTDSFDTVVDTFSLCVMGNDGARDCLKQMREVVKKGEDGGRILLIENARSSSPLLGWYQDITAETAAKAGGKGCVYNQDVTAMIRDTGRLRIDSEEAFSTGLFRSFIIQKV